MPGDPRHPSDPEPRGFQRPPRLAPEDLDFFREASARFGELTNRLVEWVNTSGGLGPEGANTAFRPILRAAARHFATAASGLSAFNRTTMESGQLTKEDLDLITQVETWAAHFRTVTLTIQEALGEEPGDAPRVRSRADRDEPGRPR
jgi:hypothetical protein